MTAPRQGEVWWAEAEDKRRPVLVVTRSEAIPVLSWLVVAPVTRSVRAIPTHFPERQRASTCRAPRRSTASSRSGARS